MTLPAEPINKERYKSLYLFEAGGEETELLGFIDKPQPFNLLPTPVERNHRIGSGPCGDKYKPSVEW